MVYCNRDYWIISKMNGYEKRTQQKRRDILLATKYLVSNIPMNSISILEIASRANVSQVTIYNIFQNKKNLLDEAIKELSDEDIQDIWDIASSDIPIQERLPLYFKASFEHSLKRPQHRFILDYIFADAKSNLYKFVTEKYLATTPHLLRLYDDGIKAGMIRKNISKESFLKLLDICTRIERHFFIVPDDRDLLIECIIHSFK